MTAELDTTELTQQGIEALRRGDREHAQSWLSEAVRRDPSNEQAWLWLSAAVDAPQSRVDCLRQVLRINPAHERARQGLQRLTGEQTTSVAPTVAGESGSCPRCGGTGGAPSMPCPKCGGGGTEACPTCQGQAVQECAACLGQGWRPHKEPAALGFARREVWVRCADCGGTGYTDCVACRGVGQEWCSVCGGGGTVVCPDCIAERLAPILDPPLAAALLHAFQGEIEQARREIMQLRDVSPLARFLWQSGFVEAPYTGIRRLHNWSDIHPEDKAASQLAMLLPPPTPYEPLPARQAPVQLPVRPSPDGSQLEQIDRPVVPLTQTSTAALEGALLHDAIKAVRSGNRDQALVLLMQVVEQKPDDVDGWLWLSRVVETDAQREKCLQRVLALRPGHPEALANLEQLQHGPVLPAGEAEEGP